MNVLASSPSPRAACVRDGALIAVSNACLLQRLPNNDTQLALAALRVALTVRAPSRGLGHHTDRGSPYASDEYRAELAAHGIVQSMSRKGDCWDNAVAESFFSTMRAGHVDHGHYPTAHSAMNSVDDYIANFYNLRRRHSTLGYLSPIEFELRSQTTRQTA